MAKSCNCLNKNKPLAPAPSHSRFPPLYGVKRKVPHLGLQILSFVNCVRFVL